MWITYTNAINVKLNKVLQTSNKNKQCYYQARGLMQIALAYE